MIEREMLGIISAEKRSDDFVRSRDIKYNCIEEGDVIAHALALIILISCLLSRILIPKLCLALKHCILIVYIIYIYVYIVM